MGRSGFLSLSTYEEWIRLLDAGEGLRESLEENKSTGKLKLSEV
jgi:hypothetical protein